MVPETPFPFTIPILVRPNPRYWPVYSTSSTLISYLPCVAVAASSQRSPHRICSLSTLQPALVIDVQSLHQGCRSRRSHQRFGIAPHVSDSVVKVLAHLAYHPNHTYLWFFGKTNRASGFVL